MKSCYTFSRCEIWRAVIFITTDVSETDLKSFNQLGLNIDWFECYNSSIKPVLHFKRIFISSTLVLRKQRNTIHFGTIRLKWGTGFKIREHLKPSIKKRTIYSLRPCDVSGAVAYNTACLKQKQTIIPCVPYLAIISEQFLIASVAVSKCDLCAMITWLDNWSGYVRSSHYNTPFVWL